MENNYAVTTMLLLILIALPSFATATVCLFNRSDVVPRKVILLNQGNRQHIRINDATINIDLGKPYEYVSPFLRTVTYSITAVRFTGNVSVIRNESKNYELYVTKLEGLREHFRKSETGRCSISFVESNKTSGTVQPEVEDAIIRVAESCIRSAFCQPNINEVDKDANLIYESVQSSLNEIFDYIVPKIMPQYFKSTDYVRDLNYDLEHFATLVTIHSFNVLNLPTIRRLRDFVILLDESNKFTVSGMFRFDDMCFSFIKSIPLFGTINRFFFSNNFTIKFTLEFEVNFDSCRGTVVFVDLMYADNSTTGDELTDFAFKNTVLDMANELTGGISFDCEGPINAAISRIIPFNLLKQ